MDSLMCIENRKKKNLSINFSDPITEMCLEWLYESCLKHFNDLRNFQQLARRIHFSLEIPFLYHKTVKVPTYFVCS